MLISLSALIIIMPITTYGTCGLEILSITTPPDFGDLEVGEISNESSINLRKTGEDDGILSFTSTAWKNSDNTNIMNRGSTHYSLNQNIEYENMNEVSDGNTNIKTMKVNVPFDLYLKVFVDWLSPIESSGGFFGQITQEFTFTVKCI